jgi:hypothetical protein
MIIFYNIIPNTSVKNTNSQRKVEALGRVRKIKKISKHNKDFLRALGFKL